jgi:hypothetical protein
MRFRGWFIAGLWAFGALSALAVARVPALAALPVPGLLLPLALSLVVDVATMPLVRQGRLEALTINDRAFGVIGAGLLHTLILMALGA